MALTTYNVSGKVYASDSSTPFPDVEVIVRNTTTNSEILDTTDSNGDYSIDLADLSGGYDNGDSLEITANLGSFYKQETATVNTGVGSTTQNLTLATGNKYEIIDLMLIKTELIEFLRNNITDPNSRLTSQTDTFSPNGSTVKFTLTKSTGKNIRYVAIDGTIKARYTDYYVEYKDSDSTSNPVIYFLTPPGDSTTLEVKYDYGTSAMIYGDVPQVETQLADYPRISIDVTTGTSREYGLNAESNVSDLMVSTTVWSEKIPQVEDLVSGIKKQIAKNKKNFYFFNLIVPLSLSPLIDSPERSNRMVQRTQDFQIKWRLENV